MEASLIPKRFFALYPTSSSILELYTVLPIAKYLKNNLQYIFKTVIETKTIIAINIFADKPCEKFLKVKFLDVYYNKTYINYYNFC